nr:hypothetical protein [Tanacetum cinerariifolium]
MSNTLHNAIMEAGSKDRPPMLAPGKRYIDTKPNHELIHYCLTNPPYELGWIDKEIPISEGSPITRTKKFQETYKNVSQDIYNQLNAEAEAVQIILIGIDNDIYSTVDACPNSCEMWKAIKRLKQEWQRFVTLVKQNQKLKTVLYHKLYDILKQHQHEVNEIRAERIACVVNPLTLVAQQQRVYHPQTHPTHYTQNSSTRLQQTATRNRGKAIVNSPQPIYDQEPSMVAEDDETSKDKEIDKLMALISLSISNVTWARETVGSMAVQKSGIQCYNCKEFGHVAKEYQADWRDDTDDDELEDQEVEAHYMYMAQLQEVSLDAADSGPIFDDEPLQKVSNDDHYNVFAMESKHPEQSISVHDTYYIEQDAQNVIIDSLDMSYDREKIDQNDDDNDLANERELLASLIEKLKCEIDESKNRNKFLKTSNKVLIEKLKDKVTNLQCDYLELLEKCEGLETELSKSKMMSKSFESVQKHAINLELELQQCKEKIKNDMLFKLNKTKDFCKEREQYFKIKDLKAQLQDKGIVIKSTSVTQTHVSNDFSKPVTAQTLPPNKKSILKNTNVLAPGMYKIHTDHNQTRTSQLLQDSRKTNKRVSFSTGVILTTSVSRPQLKSNPMGDRVMRNNSQGKKQEVEDKRRNVKLSKNKTSVTACNDSLNAKTLNVKYVCATCDKCVLIDKHDICVLNSIAIPTKRTVASESNKKPRNFTRKLYEHVNKTCSWWYSKFTPSGY